MAIDPLPATGAVDDVPDASTCEDACERWSAMARSATAEMVQRGFTPSDVGNVDPSHTSIFGYLPRAHGKWVGGGGQGRLVVCDVAKVHR
jgi:hypothetical protein